MLFFKNPQLKKWFGYPSKSIDELKNINGVGEEKLLNLVSLSLF